MTTRMAMLITLVLLGTSSWYGVSWAQDPKPKPCQHVVLKVVVGEVSIYWDWRDRERAKWHPSRIPKGTRIDSCAPNYRYQLAAKKDVVWIDQSAVAVGAPHEWSAPPGPQPPTGGSRAFNPSGPVTIVVTAAPGSPGDTVARRLSDKLAEIWGVAVIVENRQGAGGAIGARYVATAARDGRTLLLASESAFVVDPTLLTKPPLDPSDFVPVSGLVSIPYALVVHRSVPATNVKELIDFAKKAPGRLRYGITGSGSPSHLTMALFQAMAGVTLAPVPYQGTGPALNALITDDIAVMFTPAGGAQPLAQTGTVRMLAVSHPRRLTGLPDVPTVAETGLDNFNATSWLGLFAPAGVPAKTVQELNSDVQWAISLPSLGRDIIGRALLEPFMNSPEEFAGQIRSETTRWGQVIRAGGIKPQ